MLLTNLCRKKHVAGILALLASSLLLTGCATSGHHERKGAVAGAATGALLGAISTMEKRFELSSTVSGVMLASYDIGFLITTIPLEALTRNMNRGRVLGFMSLLIGLASFLYSVPHFATPGKCE